MQLRQKFSLTKRSHILTASVLVLGFGVAAAAMGTPGAPAAQKTTVGPQASSVLSATATASPTPSVSPSPKPTIRPGQPASAAVSPVAAHSGSNFAFGIAGNMASLSAAQLGQRLDGIKATGAGWVRYDLEWSNIEQTQGQYNWSPYDREVQAVAARGLKSLVIIDYSPAWARRSDCAGTKMCAPADPNAYANFAAAAAARYKGYGVHSWEIWNEPNNLNFYQPAASPGDYTQMLKAAYVRIKQVDSQAWVLTGGTAPESSAGGYLSPVDFLNGLYAAGARGYFDAVSAHPYTWPYSPAWYNPNGAWGQMTTMHNAMASNGDGGKKIWITEYGAPTNGPGTVATSGFSTAEGHADHVTEALQAKLMTDSINIESGISWIGPLFWYSYQDAGTTNDTVENFFGLLRADGSAKPAYGTFLELVRTH